MKKTPSSARVAFLAIFLVVLGFVLGTGYQTLQHANRSENGNGASTEPRSPIVRNLRVSPDDRLLAFTAIYNQAQQAGRLLFDLQTYRWNEDQSPSGWQDSITQWSADGRSLLFARERLPRPPGEGTSGLYEEYVSIEDRTLNRTDPASLTEESEPPGEQAYAGFWTGDGKLVMKTRRESKALFLKQENGSPQRIDESPGTYYQNRSVQEGETLAYYVVRDISVADETVGLFRIANGQTRQIGSTLKDVVWAYLAENAQWMIVCRYAENGEDWLWSLYRISGGNMKLEREAEVPEDVIAVYWSPDFKRVLGAVGESLWIIEVPSLGVRKLGDRDDWNADDAAWLNNENAVIVAADGQLWKVNVATGARREIWKFPEKYWR